MLLHIDAKHSARNMCGSDVILANGTILFQYVTITSTFCSQSFQKFVCVMTNTITYSGLTDGYVVRVFSPWTSITVSRQSCL